MENESPNGDSKKDSLVQQFEKTLFNDAVDTKEFGIKEAPAGMYFENTNQSHLLFRSKFQASNILRWPQRLNSFFPLI